MSKVARHLDISLDEKRLSELMRKAQEGDSISYRALLIEIEKMILSFVRNSFFRLGLGASRALEDVVQEILLSVHAKRSTYDPNQFFLPWLYSIAKYKVIDHARAIRTVSKYIDLELDLAELNIAVTDGEETGASYDLSVLFDELPEKQKRLLELTKIQGLTIAEAATQTGFSPSDVKVSVHRAIKTLQKRMREGVIQ